MKELFILSEEEKTRILGMHTLATKNLYLSEAEMGGTAQTMTSEADPAIIFISDLFKLGRRQNPNLPDPKNFQKYRDAKMEILKRAKIELKGYDKNKLTEMAKQAGITEDNIKALQSELVKMAGYPIKFTDSAGVEHDFIDGKLGTNTVDAYLDYQIKTISRSDGPSKSISKTVPIGADTNSTIKPVYKRN